MSSAASCALRIRKLRAETSSPAKAPARKEINKGRIEALLTTVIFYLNRSFRLCNSFSACSIYYHDNIARRLSLDRVDSAAHEPSSVITVTA